MELKLSHALLAVSTAILLSAAPVDLPTAASVEQYRHREDGQRWHGRFRDHFGHRRQSHPI